MQNGDNAGIKGRIFFIFKNTLFLINKKMFPHEMGVFVERNKNVLILGHDLIEDNLKKSEFT